MAELPVKVHLTKHPFCLKIHGHLVYEDEDQSMRVHLIMEIGGILRVRLHQEEIPSEGIGFNTIVLTTRRMPRMWRLNPAGQYVDNRFRFWRIVHHVKENGVEEMILELMEDV